MTNKHLMCVAESNATHGYTQSIGYQGKPKAKMMVVDGVKHGVCSGKSLPATGLAMLPIPALVKRPRFKTPRAHVCDHAPENTQNRAARCCYATHSCLTSPQRPFSSTYVPICRSLRPFCDTRSIRTGLKTKSAFVVTGTNLYSTRRQTGFLNTKSLYAPEAGLVVLIVSLSSRF